jgi:hypothetical protein
LTRHFTEVLAADGRDLTSVELVAAISRASELSALVEDMRARMLRGAADVHFDDLVRMQRLADTSVRRLALPNGAQQAAPSLGSLLQGERS